MTPSTKFRKKNPFLSDIADCLIECGIRFQCSGPIMDRPALIMISGKDGPYSYIQITDYVIICGWDRSQIPHWHKIEIILGAIAEHTNNDINCPTKE